MGVDQFRDVRLVKLMVLIVESKVLHGPSKKGYSLKSDELHKEALEWIEGYYHGFQQAFRQA